MPISTPPRSNLPALATSGAALVVAAFVVGKVARDALLLSSFDVRSLPLLIGIAAAISIPLVLVTGRLMVRFGPSRLMTVLNAASAALLIVEWAVFERSPRMAALAVFLHLSSLGAVLVSGFWSIINERFDARTAKRHIGRIGMAATIGGIAGGLIAERAAVFLEPAAILLVLAGLQLACALVLHLLADPHARPPLAVDAAPRSALGHVARSSLLRNLAFVLVFDAIAATALDYVFKARVQAEVGVAGTLRFFAIFYIATSVISALLQLAATRALLLKLGVVRSITVLPVSVTLFGVGALVAPGLPSAITARGGEMVARSTIYRVAYELLYAPLLEGQKRSTKVVLDVGAERIGDLLGAQIVGLVLYATPAAGTWLVVLAIAAGLAALVFARRLPRAYTVALEHSLRTRAPEPAAARMASFPTLSDAGDLTSLALLELRAPFGDRMSVLRGGQPDQILRALVTPLEPGLAPAVLALLGRPDTVAAAVAALRPIAHQTTGVLADALLNPATASAIRRRLPGLLEHAEPELAGWALWRALDDPSAAVRVRCGRALARLHSQPRRGAPDTADVFAVVLRELARDPGSERPGDSEDVPASTPHADLDHVFTLLGLVLPRDPLQIAMLALHTTDDALRGTAFEYLESVLPAEIRTALWPRLDMIAVRPAAPTSVRTRAELVASLQESRAIVSESLAHLRARDAASGP